MLMMSTWSLRNPSPLGSIAQSIACISATPLHAVEMDEQTLTAYRLARGATPLVPPMMSATCVPCPPSVPMSIPRSVPESGESIGSGSGASSSFGQASPVKS